MGYGKLNILIQFPFPGWKILKDHSTPKIITFVSILWLKIFHCSHIKPFCTCSLMKYIQFISPVTPIMSSHIAKVMWLFCEICMRLDRYLTLFQPITEAPLSHMEQSTNKRGTRPKSVLSKQWLTDFDSCQHCAISKHKK